MPEMRVSVPPRSRAEVVDLAESLRAQYGGRNGEYAANRDYYAGKHWNAELNPAPKNRYCLTMNYIKTSIDKDVQGLLGRMFGLQVIPRGVDEHARRVAEACEAVLYGTYAASNAPTVFERIAFNQFLLRRGILYYWWDPASMMVRFRSIAPDNFYPVYDGEEIVEAVVMSRRNTRVLQAMYPKLSKQIFSDSGSDEVRLTGGYSPLVSGQIDALSDSGSVGSSHVDTGYTTVVDWYDRDGNWVRIMGDATHEQNLGYNTGRIPFIEFTNGVMGDEQEPRSNIEDIIELNMYLDQLVSQQADIIKKYSNPTIIDKGSGQAPEVVRRTVGADGAVLPIRKDGEIYFLNWDGSQPPVLEMIGTILGAIQDLSSKPASSYGQTVTNQSGVMTNMALSPMMASTESRQKQFGHLMSLFNEDVLRIYEKFAAGEELKFAGTRSMGSQLKQTGVYNSTLGYDSTTGEAVYITGKDINGWYRNRIKWPSAIRTDDPIYIQNELSKMQSQPPAQSVYTTLENLGVEDVEAEIDRILTQLEDPRLHPDVMSANIDAAAALQGNPMPGDAGGFGGAADMGTADLMQSAEASGSPMRDQKASIGRA